MISVDDLDDQYGSPNLDDLIAVSRKLNELAESKGFPDDVAIEVASPGAERKLTIPEDLLRFRELKMKVIYNDDENDNPENETMILNVEDFEEESGLVVFRLADVQENRPPKKGMPMSKKKKEWRKKVKYVDIASANLYIDTAI
jgi:ribosome maturation factor RimP